MTSIASLITPAERERLAVRLAELLDLARLAAEPGRQQPPPPPIPLCRPGRRQDQEVPQ